MELQLLAGWGAAPVVVGLVYALRKAYPTIPKRMIPLLDVAFAVGWNLACAWYFVTDYKEALLVGVLVGLLASGAWSGGKALAGR